MRHWQLQRKERKHIHGAAGRPQTDEVPVVLGELALDPAPRQAAEVGSRAPAHANRHVGREGR